MTIWRSNRPGRNRRAIEDIGPVGRRQDDDARVRLEAVHLDEELVERLFALVVDRADVDAALPADRVQLVDEQDVRGLLLGLLEQVAHRAAPTPTNISTKSLPLIEKNGTWASPATARASSVLPVPGGPVSSTPLGMVAPRAR